MKASTGNRTTLKSASITRISLSSLLMMLTVFIAVGIVIYNYIFDTLSSARLMNLQQSGYSLNLIKNAVSGMSDIVLSTLDDMIEDSPDGRTLPSVLTSDDELKKTFESHILLMKDLGFEMSVDIAAVGGQRYSSDPLYESSLKSFISSQWFINMVYGTNLEQDDKVWGIRTIDPAEKKIMVLSYSRAIRNADGTVLGALIVNINHSVLYETYSKLLDSYSSNTVHVITEDGTIISHQNESLIGFHMYDKTYMLSKMPHNASALEKAGERYYLVTTYFEPESSWVIVEKLPVSSLLQPLQPLLVALLFIIISALALSCLIGMWISRSITKRLSVLTSYMTSFQTEQSVRERFPLLETDYQEVYTLGSGFNTMMENISELIENIRTSELERQKVEFNFLQAQINPHFLHNTLLSIKSLIMLKRDDDALEMLQSFLGLVRTPINVQDPMISFEEEIISLKNYIHIMEYRYSTRFLLTVDLAPDILQLEIPQMTLQPIIENCIFHGFANTAADKRIDIFSSYKNGTISISIRDNGKGMTKQQLENIWLPNANRQHSFNHVSMGNIRKRFHWIYGETADIQIKSSLDSGTTVTLNIPASYHPCD